MDRFGASSSCYNIHTREALGVVYRDAPGRYDPEALARLNYELRCHYTGEVAGSTCA